MKAPRLHEVTARVVAWHNRHPLARRIDPTQVHSIGEVQLPFASALPWAGAAGPLSAAPQPLSAATPTLAEALAQRNARHAPAMADAAGIGGLDVQSMLPEAADAWRAPTANAPPPDGVDLALDATNLGLPADDDGEAALVIPLLDGDEVSAPPPDSAAATAPAAASAAGAAGASPAAAPAYPPSHGSVPASALARAVERRATARAASAGPTADLPPSLAAAPANGRWRRLADVLRRALTGRQAGLPPLRAAFSRDFIWPLRPGQVARWAQRHGQPQPVSPADWPQRCIGPDPARLARLRQKGLVHDLPLHVLTAAIGVGDRRIRVLLAADGSILGPRAYQRARVGSASLLLALGLLGAGWSLRPLHGPADGDGAAMLVAAERAAAASAAASAPLAAPAPDAADSTTVLADAAGAASVASAADGAASSAHADAAAADAAASRPQANIRPDLSGEQKYAARVEAARLRGEPVPAPPPELLPGPVYAVVSPASRQRDAAASSLVLMQATAARLDGGVPAHGELLESQGQWRAAWWPFASLVDAERARVLLAGRGLKAEVIEF